MAKNLKQLGLSLEQKRRMVQMPVDDYSVRVLCDRLGRSSDYYQLKQQDENEVNSAIQDVVAEWPTYGYRRVTNQLQRRGGALPSRARPPGRPPQVPARPTRPRR